MPATLVMNPINPLSQQGKTTLNRFLQLALPLLALPLLALTPAAAPGQTLKVMTFNVRYASDDGPQAWPVRRPVMIALLKQAQPDLIGTQELLQRQGDDLIRALPGYRWFGRDRRGEHKDEHMGVFYRPDRLRVVRQGDFWLSDTPDVVGSSSWGTDLPRMATWAVFETLDKPTSRKRKRFVFVDTHLAHRDQDDDARDRAAATILARLPKLAAGLPVILAGDMNARPETAAYKRFAKALTDARTTAAQTRGPENTFHDFTGNPDRRIDYLFVRGFKVETVETDTFHEGTTYPSDHFPVTATVSFR